MTSLTKICLHWTAGADKPCEQNLNCYHFLFDKDGKEYKGRTLRIRTWIDLDVGVPFGNSPALLRLDDLEEIYL